MTPLTRYEQETIISFNAGEQTATVYTRDKIVQYIRAKNMILEYLEINGTIKNSKIRELCGFTKQQARSTIDKMIEEKLIDRVGAGSATEYKLK